MTGNSTQNGPDGSRPRVVHVEVEPAQAGQRLDNFLLARLKGVPRTRVYRLVRRGEVRVNGGRARPALRLESGDVVRIPPVRTAQRAPVRVPDEALEAVASAVIHEDPDVLVLNKPAGMPVHAGSGAPWGLIEALRQARPGDGYLELGHRLDRDTSGCLVVARHPQGLRRLRRALSSDDARKRYLLLVRGSWPGDLARVDAPLRRNVLRGGERLVAVDDTGKPAATRFRAVHAYRDATLVAAALETGRTHQIRVHAAHAGHPVAGDERYGDADFNRRLRGVGLRRLFLHAQSVSVPMEPGDLDVEAPLPAELRAVLDALSREPGSPGS